MRAISLTLGIIVAVVVASCDLIRMKKDAAPGAGRKAVARVNDVYLYQDELAGIVSDRVSKEDSAQRVQTYIDSWVRKQLLISQAMKTIDINEAEVERKVLEYRYTLIGYEYQNFYINKNLDNNVSDADIQKYYTDLNFLRSAAVRVSPLEAFSRTSFRKALSGVEKMRA